jgi:hypothetical protein
MRSKTTLSCALVLGAAAVAACGSTSKPTYQLTQSEAAVRAAEEVGAKDTPQAALHLKMARDQVTEAKRLIIDEKYEPARHLLRRAEADANLAIALAKASRARAEADEVNRNLERLRREME